MVNICFIKSCPTRKNRKQVGNKSELQKLSLHSPPLNEQLRIKWERALGCTLPPQSKICSLHFKLSDYSISTSIKSILLPGSVPSLFSPQNGIVPIKSSAEMQTIQSSPRNETRQAPIDIQYPSQVNFVTSQAKKTDLVNQSKNPSKTHHFSAVMKEIRAIHSENIEENDELLEFSNEDVYEYVELDQAVDTTPFQSDVGVQVSMIDAKQESIIIRQYQIIEELRKELERAEDRIKELSSNS